MMVTDKIVKIFWYDLIIKRAMFELSSSSAVLMHML